MGDSYNDICHMIHKTVHVLLFYVFALLTKVKNFKFLSKVVIWNETIPMSETSSSVLF